MGGLVCFGVGGVCVWGLGGLFYCVCVLFRLVLFCGYVLAGAIVFVG